jgi:hypothetical protein
MKKNRRKYDASGRTVGAGGHVRLHYWLLASPAWASLSCEARALLVELYGLYHGHNNGNVFLSVREGARRLRVGKSTAGRAFGQLCERGFIKPNVQGAFSRKVRHATTWVLTEFEYHGALATKDFVRWRPSSENQNTVPLQVQTVPPQGQMHRAA